MKIFRAEPSHQHHLYDDKIGLVDSLFIRGERQKTGFNLRMFNEDFSRLFRSASYGNGNLFELVTSNEELTKKLFGSVITRSARLSVGELIHKFVEEIAKSLIWFGSAYYFLYDDETQKEINIASLSSSGVVNLFGTYVQWVPKRTQRHLDRDNEKLPREIRILNVAKLMCFDMPTSIKCILSRQNQILATLDNHMHNETNFFPRATHENPNPTNNFDFSVWKNNQERALYRATQGSGWNGREYDSPKCSDFFDCHRLIRFRRNQLMLRDDILKQLSSELSRVGKSYEAEFSVEISSTDKLPSVENLNELEAKLSREEIGFNEVLDYCYKC
jgi:hypothetical protein